MESWICVRTQPRREDWAVQSIQGRYGLQVYHPLYREKQYQSGRISYKIRPMFPSYIFVQIVNGQWYFLLSTFGVARPVLAGDAPEVVPNRVIELMQKRTDEFGLFRPFTRRLGYQKGQRLEIKNGPFAGEIGIYEGMTAHDRVAVLLSMFGRRVVATVRAQEVRAA